MKLLSIIGTRPQYIKIKPIFDYCINNNIEHIIVDTFQHYSPNVSKVFIDEFGLKIDYQISVKNLDELEFMSNIIIKIRDILKEEVPDMVIVYGDTNSTFCAALAAFKLNIPIAHVEAGVRGFYVIPEEINRVFTDSVSNLKFCSSLENLKNVEGIFSGDLEYELLNKINPNIENHDFGVMTIHRQSNVNEERLIKIFNFCEKIEMKIKFFVHHRTKNFLDNHKINIPNNIELLEPCSYGDMVESMSKCNFIITDSGSVQKSSPFFGKKALIMREEGFEWINTERYNYARKSSFSNDDIKWLLSKDIEADKRFYMSKDLEVSEIIIKEIMSYLEEVR